uniref:Uncharacterized protein n=1 Tax=Anguilla anguilla TaxID=7936 RepID=A0A0E9R9D2_ANGAN
MYAHTCNTHAHMHTATHEHENTQTHAHTHTTQSHRHNLPRVQLRNCVQIVLQKNKTERKKKKK